MKDNEFATIDTGIWECTLQGNDNYTLGSVYVLPSDNNQVMCIASDTAVIVAIFTEGSVGGLREAHRESSSLTEIKPPFRFPDITNHLPDISGYTPVTIDVKRLLVLAHSLNAEADDHRDLITIYVHPDDCADKPIAVLGKKGIGILMPCDCGNRREQRLRYESFRDRFRRAWNAAYDSITNGSREWRR